MMFTNGLDCKNTPQFGLLGAGMVAEQLTPRILELEAQAEALKLRSFLRQKFSFTLFLFTQLYKLVLVIYCWGYPGMN